MTAWGSRKLESVQESSLQWVGISNGRRPGHRRLLAAAGVALLLASCSDPGGERGKQPSATRPSRTAPPITPSATSVSPTATTTTARSPSPGASAPTPSPAPLGRIRLRAVPVATLEQPLALAVREGDPTLYVAEKVGRVRAVVGGEVRPTAVLDISDEVSLGGEQGLLGIAFSPDGRFLYVNYTDVEGDTRVAEFPMRRRGAVERSRREVLFVDQPYSNHNGGNMAFGPDGYLYIGLGDGGSGGDPHGYAQSLDTLLGKMLRIDPRPRAASAYDIPPDNPFRRRAGARPEIWAYGLRNPWRFSFDRLTGDLWIGDVGQGAREEIDVQPAASGGGENYGWDLREGTEPYEGEPPPGAMDPIYDYPLDDGACAVTGGYVYRGGDIPELWGAYLFGDFCRGRVMGLRRDHGTVRVRALGPTIPSLSSFGEDGQGELYALSLSDGVFRLESASR